jgi:hypothetical protein
MDENQKKQLEARLKELLAQEAKSASAEDSVGPPGGSGSIIRRRKGERDKRI